MPRMFGKSRQVLVLLAFILCSVHGQAAIANQCRIPYTPRTQSVDPAQLSGVWYEYLVYTPGTIGDNVYNTLVPLTTVSNGGSMTYNRTIIFLLRTPAPVCVGICLVANVGTDGKEYNTGWFPSSTPGAPPDKQNVVYNTIFTDYHTVQIKHLCNGQPPASGYCDSPYYWVYTRVKPTLLDQATKNFVQATVDNVLQDFCITTRNLTVTGWDDNLPACRPTLPADCTALMQSMKQTSSQSNQNGNSYAPPPMGANPMAMMGNLGFGGFRPDGIGWRPA